MQYSDSERDLSGTVLDRYHVLRRIGRGGMGTVYEAQHHMLDQRCALKVLARRFSSDARARKRFLREARAASRVSHPNVVEIHDVGFTDEHVYFAMELLAGHDLDAHLSEKGKRAWPEAKLIGMQVAAALVAAHEVGVVHRDIKPANCFLVDGDPSRVKVLDFGIAGLAGDTTNPMTDLTSEGDVFGTAGYMPPETSQGVNRDPRSDIYSFGVMLFTMLTGRLPFEGSPLEVMAQHIGREPPTLQSLDPSIPIAAEEFVLRCLQKQPDDRYASMRDLLDALQSDATVAKAPTGPSVTANASPTDTLAVIDLDERTRSQPPSNPAPGFTAPVDALPPVVADVEDTALQLDLPDDWEPGDKNGTPLSAQPRKRSAPPLGMLVGALLVGAVGFGVWKYRDSLPQQVEESVEVIKDNVGVGEGNEEILLLVDTVPKKAQVFIDDTPRDERPIPLPRSEDYIKVRVEAEGYEPRTIQVQPTVTRRLEVKLDRARKRKRK